MDTNSESSHDCPDCESGNGHYVHHEHSPGYYEHYCLSHYSSFSTPDNQSRYVTKSPPCASREHASYKVREKDRNSPPSKKPHHEGSHVGEKLSSDKLNVLPVIDLIMNMDSLLMANNKKLYKSQKKLLQVIKKMFEIFMKGC